MGHAPAKGGLAKNGRRVPIYSIRNGLGGELWWSCGKKAAQQWLDEHAEHKDAQYGPLTLYRCSAVAAKP